MSSLRTTPLSRLVPVLVSSLAAALAQAAPAVLESAPPSGPIPQRLTWVVHAYATWSPDGREIAFQSNASGDWDLHVLDVATGAVRPLVTSRGADITPAWSPDGARVAFVSERHGHRDVFTCRPDGSDQRRLTADPGADIHPEWSRDGRRILFSSTRHTSAPEDHDIWSMAADGTGLVRVSLARRQARRVHALPAGTPRELRAVRRGGDERRRLTCRGGSIAACPSCPTSRSTSTPCASACSARRSTRCGSRARSC